MFFDPEGDLRAQIDQAVQMGATYANVAHSMHRAKGLTNEQANKIMKAILQDGRLIPWYTIEETGNVDPQEEISQAIDIGLKEIPAAVIATFPTTLEPTPGISTQSGTGVVNPNLKVSGQDALQRADSVRALFRSRYGEGIADDSNVGYGASVKSSNAEEIFRQSSVRNALIGGASLEADEFFNLVVNAIKGAPASAASSGTTTEETQGNIGGINLNPALLNLQIKRDGKGIPLPLPQQPIGNMKIEGFMPIIINITPINNLQLMLGIGNQESKREELSLK